LYASLTAFGIEFVELATVMRTRAAFESLVPFEALYSKASLAVEEGSFGV
jgi:hypothetical protein